MCTTTATKPAARTCPNCHGTGKIRQYSAMSSFDVRCRLCAGRGKVGAAAWLAAFRAAPSKLSREEAIARAAQAIGMDHRTGGDLYGSYVGDYQIAPNGLAGLVVDMEECGHRTVLARFLARWNEYAIPGHRAELVAMVAEVRAARAEVRAA